MKGFRSAGPEPGVRFAPPRASAMIESLRGLGYSTATRASRTFIDNSIAAGANDRLPAVQMDGVIGRGSLLRMTAAE